MTLGRQFTLKKTTEFKEVIKNGKKLSSDSFIFYYLKSADQSNSRFGFIISKKVSNKASLRNRSKRAMSEAVRRIAFTIENPVDCVFVAKSDIIKKYTSDLIHETESIFEKAKLVSK